MERNTERSQLYNIKPIGLFTSFVESLTSYINRLADAHYVLPGTMFNEMFVPLLSKGYLSAVAKRGGNSFFDESYIVNGYGEYAQKIKTVAEHLTGTKNLHYTTLIGLEGVLSERGLLRKSKVWCPVCYEEMEKVYEPLVWSLECSKVCTKHRIPYSNRCEACKKEISFIARGGKPGYCPYCYQWLGGGIVENQKVETDNYLYKISIFIEELIELRFSPKVERLNCCPIGESMNKWVTIVFKGNLSKASKVTGIPYSTINGWLLGKNIPRLEAIGMLCLNTNLKVEQFLMGDMGGSELTYNSVIKYNKESQKRHDHEKIKGYLSEVIAKYENLSLTQIARLVGCDRKVLTNNFPVECEIIKKRNSERELEEKATRLSVKLKNLNDCFSNILVLNQYPSRRKIEEKLGNCFLKERRLKLHWNQLKKK